MYTLTLTAETYAGLVERVRELADIWLPDKRPAAAAPEEPLPPLVDIPVENARVVDETAVAPDQEALRVQIRTILTPLMRGDKAGAARNLVKQFGSGVSAVPPDLLPALLQQAKELAE